MAFSNTTEVPRGWQNYSAVRTSADLLQQHSSNQFLHPVDSTSQERLIYHLNSVSFSGPLYCKLTPSKPPSLTPGRAFKKQVMPLLLFKPFNGSILPVGYGLSSLAWYMQFWLDFLCLCLQPHFLSFFIVKPLHALEISSTLNFQILCTRYFNIHSPFQKPV